MGVEGAENEYSGIGHILPLVGHKEGIEKAIDTTEETRENLETALQAAANPLHPPQIAWDIPPPDITDATPRLRSTRVFRKMEKKRGKRPIETTTEREDTTMSEQPQTETHYIKRPPP